MTESIYRYEVPVDDQWHEHPLSGGIVHVAGRRHAVVEFWARHTGGPTVPRQFRVFGTGHPMPEGLDHRGAVLDGPFVWHLMEAPVSGNSPAIGGRGGPWTSHGHAVDGVTVEGPGRPDLVARCGGPGLCSTCSQEAERFRQAATR